MAKSVRIWFKKQLRLEPLTFKQRDMVTIGNAGLLSVFNRLREARGPNDGPAKPLTKRYAIYKTRRGKGNVRNLSLTGQLLAGLKLRTVSDSRAYAAPDGKLRGESIGWKKSGARKVTNRDVAMGNQKREPWLVFSPENRRVVMLKTQEMLARAKAKIFRWGS